MKKILAGTLMFAILFGGGVFVGGYTVNSKWEDKIALEEYVESFDDIEADVVADDEIFEENTEEKNDENAPESANIDWQADELYAVAFLGYSNEYIEYIDYLDPYFELSYPNNYKYYDVTGDENYLIIPRYPDSEQYIVELEFDENFNAQEVVEMDISGNVHYLVKCNVSDLYSNVLIRTKIDGEIFEFSPRISLENGELVENERILSLEIIENAQK